MHTLKRTLQILPSVFRKNELTIQTDQFNYQTPTTKFMLVSCPKPAFVTLIEECLNSDPTKCPTFEEIQSKLSTIASVNTLSSSDGSDVDPNSTTEYQYDLDQNKIDQFNEYIYEITSKALDEEQQSQETIQKCNEQIQNEIERLKKPKTTPSLKNNSMLLCKLFDENKLQLSPYLQTTIFREATYLCQLHHPAIIQFASFNMYNSNILYNQGDSDYDDYEEDKSETEEEEKEEERNPMIKTSPTIFLEPVKTYPNLDNLINNLINSGCTKTFGPNQIHWNATKAYIFILGLTHAVSYLHQNGIIHRNLIPDVIHFDENLYPKLIDFSTSRQINAKKGSKDRNDLCMTIRGSNKPAYEAYEILEHTNENYDSSIDVFSLGRLIYAIIAKCHPFKYVNDANKYTTGQYSNNSLQSILPQSHALPCFECIPKPYQELLKKCWDPNPSQRPFARQIYETIKSNLDIYKTIYPNDEVDMNEVNQYIPRLEASETTLPICIYYNEHAEYNIDIPEKLEQSNDLIERLNTCIDPSKIELADLIEQFNHFISDQFIDLNNHERPLHLFHELISRLKDKCPIDIVSAFFNSEYFNKFLIKDSNNTIATHIIDTFFGTENDSTIHQKKSGCIRFPSTTEKIEAEAFSGLPECQFIYIPASVKEIGNRAFANCPKLQFVFIPRYGELSKIGEGAFAKCPSLFSFSFPDNVEIVPPHAFENDDKLANIDFNQIEDIEPYAFANCRNISKLEFPSTLKSIKEYAFKQLPHSTPIHFGTKTKLRWTPNISLNAFPLYTFKF